MEIYINSMKDIDQTLQSKIIRKLIQWARPPVFRSLVHVENRKHTNKLKIVIQVALLYTIQE